ncbi:hypothetical protein GCM10009682_06190 [Luedemannella flava]|uniref:Uncharacterized protein n=1 Tax=Luedemannella flava TaxID=349316 RepID=A0ABN2LI97_9ACTN
MPGTVGGIGEVFGVPGPVVVGTGGAGVDVCGWEAVGPGVDTGGASGAAEAEPTATTMLTASVHPTARHACTVRGPAGSGHRWQT